MRKIDLSAENVMKTQMFMDTNLLIKDYKPKYKNIELIAGTESGNLDEMRFFPGSMKWEYVKSHFGDRRILSVHDYGDTKSTSIIIERKRK